MEKDKALWICDCSICMAEKEITLYKNIAKFVFFSMQNFAFWIQNLRFFVLQKTSGPDK